MGFGLRLLKQTHELDDPMARFLDDPISITHFPISPAAYLLQLVTTAHISHCHHEKQHCHKNHQ